MPQDHYIYEEANDYISRGDTKTAYELVDIDINNTAERLMAALYLDQGKVCELGLLEARHKLNHLEEAVRFRDEIDTRWP